MRARAVQSDDRRSRRELPALPHRPAGARIHAHVSPRDLHARASRRIDQRALACDRTDFSGDQGRQSEGPDHLEGVPGTDLLPLEEEIADYMRAFNDGLWLETEVKLLDGRAISWGFTLGQIPLIQFYTSTKEPSGLNMLS